ncbi:unnamed protein product [Wuchereria bancrofti]|uniref:Uncharacterized protein n=1 Tax=Wuchereria bancrofti TaxID=6293 RepID=A0A3P7DUU5_WUCBA|nr:unnamed protein product [Wuchereria bancrofti]
MSYDNRSLILTKVSPRRQINFAVVDDISDAAISDCRCGLANIADRPTTILTHSNNCCRSYCYCY